MRKDKKITISDASSRDNGKTFLITEMPADQAEKWGFRAFIALVNAGFFSSAMPTPEYAMQTVAPLGPGMFLRMSWADAEPLLDEMFDCVQIVEDKMTRQPMGEDIAEVSTRLKLRAEVLKLHVDFSKAGEQFQKMRSTAAAMRGNSSPSNAPTSPPSSPQS